MRRDLQLDRIDQIAADQALRELASLPVELVAFAHYAERVWQLRETVAPSDAWYVAVAEAADLSLLTLDRRLASAPGPRCRFVVLR